MKPLITLKPFLHRGGEQIGIYFQNNLLLSIAIKTKAAGKCGHVPMNKELFEKMKAAFPEASMDSAELKKYLENKNQGKKKECCFSKNQSKR